MVAIRRLFNTLRILLITMVILGIFTTPASAWTYGIKRGDSLYKIARRNGTTVNRLRTANRLRSNLILAGDRLWIPTASSAQSTSRAVDLLARLIHAEAGGEPFTGQVAVGAVIMNRLRDRKFPSTIAGNVFKRGEFESVSNGYIWSQPSGESYRAAKAAVSGWDPTGGARYFFNPGKTFSAWIWSRPIVTQIGHHFFAR